jgi:hypothetical protein
MDLLAGLQKLTLGVSKDIGAHWTALVYRGHGSSESGQELAPRHPLLDGFLHCDVVQARKLVPTEESGPDPQLWTADPYVEASLVVPSDDTPTYRKPRASRTAVRIATIHPVWDEELLLQSLEGATHVRVSVIDRDLVRTRLRAHDGRWLRD